MIRSNVREVVLDLTVRKKSEKLVRDLRADEVEVRVDGVVQDVHDFRLVRGEETRHLEGQSQGEPAAEHKFDKLPSANSAREINLVALVFRAGNDVEQRARAREAALAFVAGELRPNTYIAVLTMTPSMSRVVQPFTANPTLLANVIKSTLSGIDINESGKIFRGTGAARVWRGWERREPSHDRCKFLRRQRARGTGRIANAARKRSR